MHTPPPDAAFHATYLGKDIGYVLVIARTPAGDVALVRKNRPAWQAGRLNYPGGKIEEGESPLQAAVREFREETSVALSDTCLRPVAHLTRHGQFNLFAFATEAEAAADARSETDEAIQLLHESAVRQLTDRDAIENVAWLYAMAFDGFRKCAVIHYS